MGARTLTDATLRHIAVQMYLLFMDGDGTVSFRELVKVRGVGKCGRVG